MKIIDIKGQVFGKLTVINRSGSNKCGQVKWLCLCKCGNERTITGRDLKNGHTVSCGCYKKERILEVCTTHGMSKSSEYRIWSLMKDRCNNTKSKVFKFYGGRGITVCKRWLDSFDNFFEDVGKRPKGKSLDRYPNKNGNYEPTNFRWATAKQQADNTRRNRIIEYNGETKNLREWSKILKTSDSNIHRMLKSKPFSEVYEFYINGGRKRKT